MAQEIDLGGAKYVSSRRAAEISGYAQDYIGQLARSGQIEARRVSGLWYILEESLIRHKEKAEAFVPEPPNAASHAEMDASINFDGKDYISTQRASKITGYTQDYVTQLARGGKILARQMGTRWYVDREALLEHKYEKDSLLAAVQAESVGLQREVTQEKPAPVAAIIVEQEPLKYIEEQSELLPTVDEAPEITPEAVFEDNTLEQQADEEQVIPIRIIDPIEPVTALGSRPDARLDTSLTAYISKPRITMLLLVFLGFSFSGVGVFMYMETQKINVSPVVDRYQVGQTAQEKAENAEIAQNSASFASRIFSKELYYHR